MKSNFRCLATSVIGSSHLTSGLPCQDAHSLICTPDYTAIFVSDGAGSAAYSDKGSKAAVAAAKMYIQDNLSPSINGATEYHAILDNAVQHAQLALHETAEKHEIALSQLSCTLICVLLLSDQIYISQIGDGAVVYVDSQGEFHTLSKPQHGEYINQTIFINSENAQIIRKQYQGSLQGVAVFSDGIEQIALQHPSYNPFPPFFLPLMRFAARVSDESTGTSQLQRFLQSDKVRSRTSDDITLVLAVNPDFT